MVAIPKNGFDDIVRAATELGVYRIIPLLTERGLVNPSPQKIDRWRKIAREAVEQSERQIIPIIEEPQPFLAILKRGTTHRQLVILVLPVEQWPRYFLNYKHQPR